MRKPVFDVAIVGAGAAGLYAAGLLEQKDKKVILLEAQKRIGGRIYPTFSAGGLPLELGAEFVHEESKDFKSILKKYRIPLLETEGDHLLSTGKRFELLSDVFEGIDSKLSRLKLPRGKDCSMAAVLPRKPKTISDLLAYKFVEGFNAAPAADMSARAILQAHKDAMKDGGYQSFRPEGGYSRVLTALTHFAGASELKLGKEIVLVSLESQGVVLKAANGEVFKAKRVLLTLPPSLLARNRITFHPALPEVQNLASRIGMGSALRISVQFSKAPLEVRDDFEKLHFIHLPRQAFPTWWTSKPYHSNVLTAWAGGPAADALYALPKAKLLEELRTSASFIFGRKQKPKIENVWFHNWSKDRFALGAYSYVKVGEEDAAHQLSRPIGNKIFFAGEALASGGIGGTVGSALESASRAVKQILNVS